MIDIKHYKVLKQYPLNVNRKYLHVIIADAYQEVRLYFVS